jgi:uncharacterized protein (DUF433 family)
VGYAAAVGTLEDAASSVLLLALRYLHKGERAVSHPRISANPAVMMGKPCIKGTRITVELILRKLGAGRTFADLLEAYPHLSEDDIRAALAFAADYMQHETVLAAE